MPKKLKARYKPERQGKHLNINMEYETTVTRTEPIVITIGNFDGVHIGHQRLMHELRNTAQQLNSKPVLITFSPHTLIVVRPDIDVRYLTTLEEKLALAKKYGGIADSIVMNFTPAVAAISAGEFMQELSAHFNIKGMVVGTNFSLGHNRMGNVAFLQQYGQENNIVVHPISLEEVERTHISSTRIRTLVSEGRISDANELLGHPLTLSDVVRRGAQRGRLLGFPTANLIPEAHKLLPADGVYAVRVSTNGPLSDGAGASRVYNGVVNIGVRPTFNEKERIVEVHLLDVQPDLYDKRITIDFIARLRNEQRFANIDALKSQIAADVQQARQVLN
ncbi:MAG: bifunctional riboflavin kinase/FAD synthetase [Chloroflexi bacterium]|nr:MAG: bifunctional riboflavin kinase/FAD synthetase [Chloroflexota bacterium]